MLTLLAACAVPVSRYRDDSVLALERVKSSNMGTLLPAETNDFFHTVDLGELENLNGNVRAADEYYALALGKAELLESLFLQELKKREEAAARLESALKQQAEAELERQQQEKEKIEALAREAARLKQLENEKAEARRKAEKARQDKEVQTVSHHTVKRGETLPQIAAMAEVFGDSSLWPLIYRANRDQISNPAVLWPGQVLRIPRNSDKSDISEARRFATERPLR